MLFRSLEVVLGHLRDAGRTVLLVSHSTTDVERVADRVVILDEGRVKFAGDLEDARWDGDPPAAPRDLDRVFRDVVTRKEEPCVPSR